MPFKVAGGVAPALPCYAALRAAILSVRCHSARLIFTSASMPLTSRLVARRGRLLASRPIAVSPPRIAFSCTRLNVRHRSLPTSSRRRGVRSCSGLMGVSVSPSASANRTICAASAMTCALVPGQRRRRPKRRPGPASTATAR